MAHEIHTNEDGKAEAMFAYKAAWHGLGTVVNRDVSPMEALKISRLNWAVRKEPLYRTNLEQLPDRVAICRGDNGLYLGVVGKDYQPVQNLEQAAFIEELCGEGNAVVDACGALRNGRRIFWTVKLANALSIGKNKDSVSQYLILANGHDGSLAFRAFWSPVRVVCSNTLNAALRGVRSGLSLRHTGNISRRVSEAREVLGLAGEYYYELGERFDALAEVALDDAGFSKFLDRVTPIPHGADLDSAIHAMRNRITANWQTGRGADLAGQSMWRAYNAITEYVSHQRPVRGKNPVTQAEHRFDAIFLGAGRTLQQKAFEAALQLSGLN